MLGTSGLESVRLAPSVCVMRPARSNELQNLKGKKARQGLLVSWCQSQSTICHAKNGSSRPTQRAANSARVYKTESSQLSTHEGCACHKKLAGHAQHLSDRRRWVGSCSDVSSTCRSAVSRVAAALLLRSSLPAAPPACGPRDPWRPASCCGRLRAARRRAARSLVSGNRPATHMLCPLRSRTRRSTPLCCAAGSRRPAAGPAHVEASEGCASRKPATAVPLSPAELPVMGSHSLSTSLIRLRSSEKTKRSTPVNMGVREVACAQRTHASKSHQ